MNKKTEVVPVAQEIANFIVSVLRDPRTKENSEMVSAIAELHKTIT